MKKALLVLEDGTTYEGTSIGAFGESIGEVVFNTSMSGYQEVLTDPSYKGQMVAMTYPLIGNYGIVEEDAESAKICVEAFIVKECSRIYSNWRADMSVDEYLKKHNIVGIEGIDTRALTKRIREAGAMKAILSTEDYDVESLLKKVKSAPSIEGMDLVKKVSCKKSYTWDTGKDGKKKKGKYNVVVIDCGVKYNILRELTDRECKVTVVPAKTSAADILKMKPDGVMLSNGPGDPAAVPYVAETVKGLLGKVAIFGICFGHQMLGMALGGKTFKLKFGHHGGNQPVKDLVTGSVFISVQNHGFCVDIDSITAEDVKMTFLNPNDKTLEGIECSKLNAFSVQFHPESAPGPHDCNYLFDRFLTNIQKEKKKK